MIRSDPAAVCYMRSIANNINVNSLELNRTETGCLQIIRQVLKLEFTTYLTLDVYKRQSQKKTKSHVDAVLDLVDIIGHPCDQGVRCLLYTSHRVC